MDGLNSWGRSKDVGVIGLGNSTLDDVTEEVAKSQGRVVVGDAEPEKGRYYRSDHFEFAKQGVPSLYLKAGIDIIGKPDGYGLRKEKEYTANDYHKVSDEIKPDWDLAGAVEDLQLLLQIGYKVAEADKFPEWKTGAEFKARRDAMMH
jgi:Zn-dependent M28 family amino/carboxypeptidase